jgi:dienelactone hydrolase
MRRIQRSLLPGFPDDQSRAFVERSMTGGTRRFKVFIPRESFAHQSPVTGGWPRPDFPPVLLLHEFITLGPDTLELAQRLARIGYAVYVPILFGNEHEDPMSVPLAIERGISFRYFRPEWNADASSGSRPIADELAALCREQILPRHPEKRLGVIGLCISGILPVELLGQNAEIPRYTAAVVSQPSMPVCAANLERRKSLGISDEEMATARNRLRSKNLQVIGFRFELDLMSPREKFAFLKSVLGHRFIDATLPARDYVVRDHYPRAAHAVLTDGFRPWHNGEPETRAHFAYRQLVWFLDTRLKDSESAAPIYDPAKTRHREDPAERLASPCPN